MEDCFALAVVILKQTESMSRKGIWCSYQNEKYGLVSTCVCCVYLRLLHDIFKTKECFCIG